LLSKSDCSVEKLLDDEDIIQEFKTQNNKLLTYFDHDKMKRLIDFITVMPPSDADQKRGHKYPFLALEIFNCEINPLLEKFFEAPEPRETVSTDKEEDSMKDDEVLIDRLDGTLEEDNKGSEPTSEDAAKEESKGDDSAETAIAGSSEEGKEEDQASKPRPLTRQNTPMPGKGGDMEDIMKAEAQENRSEE
jgi:hypothetical protein